MEIIRLIVEPVEAGKIYEGEVVRIMNFGAFVQLAPNKDGLIHISKLSKERVEKVEDVVNIGDKVKVKVLEIDKMEELIWHFARLSNKLFLRGGSEVGVPFRTNQPDYAWCCTE